MKNTPGKKLTTLVLIGAVALGSLTPSIAHAQGWHGGGWGGHGGFYRHDGGLFLGLGALTLGAVALATAPVRIAADAVAPPYYYGRPVYAAPAYGYPYGYYQPYRAVVYSYPQYP